MYHIRYPYPYQYRVPLSPFRIALHEHGFDLSFWLATGFALLGTPSPLKPSTFADRVFLVGLVVPAARSVFVATRLVQRSWFSR
jgi:hypothetical protein